MSSQSQRIAENIKLARQLQLEPEALDFLSPLNDEELRALREDLSDAMFDEARPHFERAAAATKLLPNKLIADISEKIVGPLLSARIVGLLNPDTALDITLRTSDEFIADAAALLDPKSASALIKRVPVDRVQRVTQIMIQRKEYVTMGRFVDHVDNQVIGEVMSSIDDDEALLRTAFFVESKEVFNDLLHHVPPERIKHMAVLAGQSDQDLWAEALALTTHMDDEWKGRIGDIVAEEGEALLASMLENAKRLNLWDALLPVVACMSESSLQRLVGLKALADVDVLESVIKATDESDLWEVFLPLAAHMDTELRGAAAQIVERLEPEVLLRIIETANQHDLWADLLSIVDVMGEAEQKQVVALVIQQPEAVLTSMLAAVDKAGLWVKVLPLLGCMDAELRTSAAKIVERLSSDTLIRIIDVADQNNLWAELIAVREVMGDDEVMALLDLLADQPDSVVNAMIDAAHKANLWDSLKPKFEQLQGASRERAEGTIKKLGLSENFGVS